MNYNQILFIYVFFYRSSVAAAENNNTESYYEVRCHPSVGIYYRCTKIGSVQHCGSFVDRGLATDPSRFPIAWKIAVVLMSAGIFINFLMAVMAVGSFCKQSIRKKSVFGVAGSGQGLAGKNLKNDCPIFLVGKVVGTYNIDLYDYSHIADRIELMVHVILDR